MVAKDKTTQGETVPPLSDLNGHKMCSTLQQQRPGASSPELQGAETEKPDMHLLKIFIPSACLPK